MRKAFWVALAAGSILFCVRLAQAIGVRDELPAFEPLHLQGAHEGRRICPMCAYGYETGLVAFVPASLSRADAARMRAAIEPTSLGVTATNFRVFVIVMGAPGKPMLEALRSDDPRWFVAALTGPQLKAAERDFGRDLSSGTWGYSFSHRKLLRELSAEQLFGPGSRELRAVAADAVSTYEREEFPAASHRVTAAEPVVGLPCEGCEIVFAELPPQIGFRTRIAADNEPGDPLRLNGHVVDARGRPVPGIIVYAYHTNEAGRYPRGSAAARFHGRLRGWAQTNAEGFYEFVTIRPGGYPGRPDPAHIHMHVIEPGRCTYYIDDIVFDDDPRLTSKHVGTRAGSGTVLVRKNFKGDWMATREIYLGRDIPGYEQCDARAAQ